MPVRIVTEDPPARPALPPVKRSAALEARWNERRQEVIEAVTASLHKDEPAPAELEELARTVHKLAGTAGMFGEERLGEKAAALERGLRAGVDPVVRKQLAEELLEVA
jgi:HPt (histidine-containing phosphotransfer) domain-containing protein